MWGRGVRSAFVAMHLLVGALAGWGPAVHAEPEVEWDIDASLLASHDFLLRHDGLALDASIRANLTAGGGVLLDSGAVLENVAQATAAFLERPFVSFPEWEESHAALQTHTPHAPIVILSDADLLLPTSGVVSGEGTEQDPFVISGWAIVPPASPAMEDPAVGFAVGPMNSLAIRIENTRKHVVVRDVVTASALQDESFAVTQGNKGLWFDLDHGRFDAGVFVNRVENLEIDQLTVLGAKYFGVIVQESTHVAVHDSTILRTAFGIAGYVASDMRVLDNLVRNVGSGIAFDGAEGLVVESNVIDDAALHTWAIEAPNVQILSNVLTNGWYDRGQTIFPIDSPGARVEGNEIRDVVGIGIVCVGCEDGALSGNVLDGVLSAGIIADLSPRVAVADNDVSRGYGGVATIASEGTLLAGNRMHDGRGYSVWLQSSHSEARENSGSDHEDGIYVFEADANVHDNAIDHARIGVLVAGAQGSSIARNEIDASEYGILFVSEADGANPRLEENEIRDTQFGILLAGSGQAVLRSNAVTGSDHGFGMVGYLRASFEHDVDTSNNVDGRPIVILSGATGTLTHDDLGDVGFLGLIDPHDLTLVGLSIQDSYQGILLVRPQRVVLEDSTFEGAWRGIDIVDGTNTTVRRNGIAAEGLGVVFLGDSKNTRVEENTMRIRATTAHAQAPSCVPLLFFEAPAFVTAGIYAIWEVDEQPKAHFPQAPRILDNRIEGADLGIQIHGDDVEISGNELLGEGVVGIATGVHDATRVLRNTVTGSRDYGIADTAPDGILSDNVVAGAGCGIYHTFDGARIERNVVQDSDVGLYLGWPSWEGSVAEHNLIERSRTAGIRGNAVDRATIQDNRIVDGLGDGVILFATKHATIRNNEIARNGQNGIRMHLDSFATVTANTIRGNGEDGIIVTGEALRGEPGGIETDYKVRGNNVEGNGGFGLRSRSSASYPDSLWHHAENGCVHPTFATVGGMDPLSGSCISDPLEGTTMSAETPLGAAVGAHAEANWWGDASGPRHASNPLGAGERASDDTIVIGWLATPVEDAGVRASGDVT